MNGRMSRNQHEFASLFRLLECFPIFKPRESLPVPSLILSASTMLAVTLFECVFFFRL